MAENDSQQAPAAAPVKKTAKVKRAEFLATFYEAGHPKYEAGKHYPLTQETKSQIVAGAAKEVTVDMDADAHAAEEKAASDALDALWSPTRKAEAEARAAGALK